MERNKVNFVAASVSRVSMGVFEVSRQLALNLADENYDVHVFGLSDEFTTEDENKWLPLQPRSFAPQFPKALGYSNKYLDALLETPANLSHLHVIWMYQSAMIYKWHKKYKRPYVTTVNGMLDPWAVKNSKAKKKVAYFLYEKNALHACSCFHVNTQKEYEGVRQFGIKAPIAIINNGVTIPDLSSSYNQPPWQGKISANKKVLLYLSRVHPKKGLMNLIEAMALLKQSGNSEFNNWVLAIVGCVEGGEHEKQLIEQVAKNKLEEHVLFFGQYYNEDMQACYYHSHAYILPSYSEGVPMAALTAWAFGKYSLFTPQCNLSDGFEAGIAERIETNPDSIAAGLSKVFAKTDEELKVLGNRAHAFVKQEYSWKTMASRMAEVYNWITLGGSTPSTVTLS